MYKVVLGSLLINKRKNGLKKEQFLCIPCIVTVCRRLSKSNLSGPSSFIQAVEKQSESNMGRTLWLESRVQPGNTWGCRGHIPLQPPTEGRWSYVSLVLVHYRVKYLYFITNIINCFFNDAFPNNKTSIKNIYFSLFVKNLLAIAQTPKQKKENRTYHFHKGTFFSMK